MNKNRLVVSVLVGWLLVGLLSAAPQFVQGPSARKNTCAVYDEARQVVVLYGGGVGGTIFPGTWEFDGVSWTQATAVAPPGAHESHAMVYDSQRQKVVVFGGYSGGTLNDTWEYDGVSWTLVNTSNRPPARYLHAMAYDAARGRVVAFGGNAGGSNAIGDTWEYDGVDWTEVTPASGSPSARWSVHAAFDSARGKVVLFGGTNGNDETWEWDGAAWSQMTTATTPSGRAAHAMVYDSVRSKIVMWGGNGGGTDTWEYDGNDWQQVVSSYPPSDRFGHGMAYDVARQMIVMFGGESGSVRNDTWTFDGAEWRPILDYVTSSVNGNRYALTPPMTWTDAEALAVLEGGHLVTVRNQVENQWLYQTFGSQRWIGYSDAVIEGQWVWSSGEPSGPGSYQNWAPGEPNNGTSENYACFWDQAAANGDDWNDYNDTVQLAGIIEIVVPEWTEVTPATTPPERFISSMTYDSLRGRIVVFGGGNNAGLLSDTWEYDGVDWSQVSTASSPSARRNHRMVYDSVRGKVVMFGGYDLVCCNWLNDTWEYDGVDWTPVATATTPPQRRQHAMAYDSIRAKVVMFGGEGGGSDTWEYDGIDWASVSTANVPIAYRNHAMSYDEMRGKVVMFGGRDSGSYRGETWEYDGVDWAQISIVGGPSARAIRAMTYDSGRSKVVIFGGNDNVQLNDTWEYDGAAWVQISTPISPVARQRHEIVYDSIRGKTVLFGGLNGGNNWLSDTWEYGVRTSSSVQSLATTYGTGCGTSALDFTPTSNPILGTTAGALISNAPTSFGGVMFGVSDSLVNGLPILPYSLAGVGMPGCELFQSNEIFGLPVTPVTASTLQFDVLIPANAALLTQRFFIQAFALAPGANAAQVVTSNGIAWTLGNQ